MSRRLRVLVAVVLLGLATGSVRSVEGQAKGHGDPSAIHTDPLNLDPVVRQGYEKFYNLDYDGALGYFNKVTQAHEAGDEAAQG